jgi:hypothetical protein
MPSLVHWLTPKTGMLVLAIAACAVAGCPRNCDGDRRDDGGSNRTDGGPSQSDSDAGSADGDADLATAPELPDELVRFASAAELQRFVDASAEAERRRRQEMSTRMRGAGGMMDEQDQGAAPPSPTPEATAGEPEASEASDESITNTQEQGVDEGGIVKVHGDHLVVLRRGRLFSMSLADGQIRPISQVNAFPPGTGSGSWYDEMLIQGDTIVVVGYSYGASATELGLFNIDASGVISHRNTYYLRSNDYYSSRNYASRLLGHTLVFYMPYSLIRWRYDGERLRGEYSLPGVRRWDTGRDDWTSVIRESNIFRPIQESDQPTLHTVVTCDLSTPELSCEAQGVIGPEGRSFYVSSDSVYIWVHGGGLGRDPGAARQGPDSAVYRLPLRGGEPGALWVAGAPVDQFSFKQSSDEHLNVLVRSESGGEGMWGAEVATGEVALMRTPLALFTEGVATVPASGYTRLPRPEGYTFQNRFVGDHLLYGTGSGWGPPTDGQSHHVFIHPYLTGGATTRLELPHGVDRIEVMGSAAAVIGTDGNNLHFSAIRLNDDPQIVGRYVQENAAQGEQRSHGFFFKPNGADRGMLGLPIRRGGSPGYAHLSEGSAEVLFLDVRDFRFTRLGALASSLDASLDDQCIASCVDWYGNARPIFYRGRIFALLGYELVEGRLGDGRITELRRANYFSGRVVQPAELPLAQ